VSDWSTEDAVTNGFNSSTFVYACIKSIMTSAASVKWNVKTLQGDSWIVNPEHPLNKLLLSPNEFQTWALQQEFNAAYLNLGGNALIYKVRAGDIITNVLGERVQEPLQLWIFRPDNVKPVLDSTKYISGYEFTVGDSVVTLPVNDVIHFMFPDPNEPTWGTSPLKAASLLTDTDVDSILFNRNAITNKTLPDGMLSFKNDMSKSQFDIAKAMLRDSVSGPDNAGLPIIMGSDATYENFTSSMKELDFVETQKWSGKRICSVFNVHPALVGLDDTSNFKMDTVRLTYWEDLIIPYLDSIRDGYQHSFNLDFAEPFRIEYELTNIPALRAAFTEKLKQMTALSNVGVPFNLINQLLNLNIERFNGDDISFMPNSNATTESIIQGLDPDSTEL
jgi:HK97 family phage portal protein